MLASQSDSQNNYVEIDALESILYQKQQQSDQIDNFQQFSNAQYEINNYSDGNQLQVSQQQQLDMALSSPIYENQAIVRRSESPIYSNTIQNLYSTSQNLYSNLPSNSSATSAYANMPPNSSNIGLAVPASNSKLIASNC